MLFSIDDPSTHVNYDQQKDLCTCRKVPEDRSEQTSVTNHCFSAEDMCSNCATILHGLDCEFLHWLYTKNQYSNRKIWKNEKLDNIVNKIKLQELTEFDDNGEIEDEEDFFILKET